MGPKRPWLSRTWLEAKSALPIATPERRRSDLIVVCLGLMPLFAAYVAGIFVWAAKAPPWMHGGWPLAIGGLTLSMACAVFWGLLILASMRRSPRQVSGLRIRSIKTTPPACNTCRRPRPWWSCPCCAGRHNEPEDC